MKIGFFQFNPDFGQKERNLEKVNSVLREVRDALLVLPEFFSTGYQFIDMREVEEFSEEIPNGPTTSALIEIAKTNNLYIVGGLPEKSDRGYYNSAVMVGPEGLIGVYRKTHLFFEEKLFFKPGDTGFHVWQTEVGKVGVMICFDWFFPESARVLALKGAEIIAHPSNLVLPWCPQAMLVRCLENRVYGITCNRIGVEERKTPPLRYIGQSQIVSPEGSLLYRASEEDEELYLMDLDPSSAKDKNLNPYNNVFDDRRPSYYGVLMGG